MRGLGFLLILVAGALLSVRLYVASRHNIQDATRAGKILWRLLDGVLIVLGVGAVIALGFLLAGVIGQMWENLT